MCFQLKHGWDISITVNFIFSLSRKTVIFKNFLKLDEYSSKVHVSLDIECRILFIILSLSLLWTSYYFDQICFPKETWSLFRTSSREREEKFRLRWKSFGKLIPYVCTYDGFLHGLIFESSRIDEFSQFPSNFFPLIYSSVTSILDLPIAKTWSNIDQFLL